MVHSQVRDQIWSANFLVICILKMFNFIDHNLHLIYGNKHDEINTSSSFRINGVYMLFQFIHNLYALIMKHFIFQL